jgi:hypothetical protein
VQVRVEKKASKGDLVVTLAGGATPLWFAPQRSLRGPADVAALEVAVRDALGGGSDGGGDGGAGGGGGGGKKKAKGSKQKDEDEFAALMAAAAVGSKKTTKKTKKAK